MEISNIDINSLPNLKTIDQTDNLYIFKERDGKYFLEKIEISELSAFFYDKELVNMFNAKYNELLELSSNFIQYLKDTFPTQDYIESTFSTHDYFNTAYNELQYKSKIENDILVYYTSKIINNKLKQSAKKEVEDLKRQYLTTAASNIIYNIPKS